MDTSLVAALVRDALRSAGKSRDRGRLRASDSEREQVIGALQAAFVQGRLTQDEHDARRPRYPRRGSAFALFNMTAVTMQQCLVPAVLLGRVTSLYGTAARGTGALGALAGGTPGRHRRDTRTDAGRSRAYRRGGDSPGLAAPRRSSRGRCDASPSPG